MRRFTTALVFGIVTLCGCGESTSRFRTVLEFPADRPGDIVSLRADGTSVEFISRRTGEIRRVDTAGSTGIETLGTVAVGTEGEQRGLLGTTVLDARRFAAWTDPDSLDLVVGELVDGRVDHLVWSGTSTASKAVGGHLERLDGRLLLGLGELTGWGRAHGSGALVLLDPDGPPQQEPVIVSDGWNNPFAFTVTETGAIWVADNAPDGSDLPVDERIPERLGRGDDPTAVPFPTALPQRAPAAVVMLLDGRLGVCGYLDNEMWAYEVIDDGSANPSIQRAGTIGPCQTGATVLADGSLVTVSTSTNGTVALAVRPPD